MWRVRPRPRSLQHRSERARGRLRHIERLPKPCFMHSS